MRTFPLIKLAGCFFLIATLANQFSTSPIHAGENDDPAIVPLPQAHSHNDYHHERPLLDALDRGFCSVEADVFLVDGQLLVGHDTSELLPERTLQKLYLDPLQKLIDKNNGRVFPDGPEFTLLIDFKTDGPKTYAVLRTILAQYPEVFSGMQDGQFQKRAVQVIVSGNRPKQQIAIDSDRRVGVDGRLADLESIEPDHYLPMISDRWGTHFRWDGQGEFPEEERAKLHSIVKRAHAAGRRVRFWATPESEKLWRELLAAGVDHVNTDKLDTLKDFMINSGVEPTLQPGR